MRVTSIAVACVVAFGMVCLVAGEPPLGLTDRAKCPVTGANITINQQTPAVTFKYGQKLYFSTEAAAATYKKYPRDFWLSPHDLPLPGLDGKRGLPDARNSTLLCPNSGEKMVISMKTPRVVHRYGQNIFFCCFGCVSAFWTDPLALIEA